MKKFLTVAMMILFVAMCVGCGNTEPKQAAKCEPRRISQEEAMEILASDPNAKLLDCRFQKDFDKRHIPGAINFTLEAAVGDNFEKIPNKDDILITYCGDGNRGGLTAKVLVEKGYKNVYTMGGIIDWTGAVEGTEVEEANAESADAKAKDAEAEDTDVEKEDVEDDEQ